MQPQTANKPVMDVAAPVHKPLPSGPTHAVTMPAPQPAAIAAQPAPLPTPALPAHPASAPLAVKPAPVVETPTAHDAAADTSLQSALTEDETVPKPPPAASGSHAPVALITATIFVMLVLAGLAVMVYLTSHTA
ncbi:MAG TPA: hypothetical protein VJP80_07240 [Candidatus Saccharimonadales bacterium]|nr:hypothetical protein [Candidatus Saccharimonadales bacterium]